MVVEIPCARDAGGHRQAHARSPADPVGNGERPTARGPTRRSPAFADDALVRQGDSGRSFYHLGSGTISVVREVGGGERVLVSTLAAGDCFGEAIDRAERSRQWLTEMAKMGTLIGVVVAFFIGAVTAVGGFLRYTTLQDLHQAGSSAKLNIEARRAEIETLHAGMESRSEEIEEILDDAESNRDRAETLRARLEAGQEEPDERRIISNYLLSILYVIESSPNDASLERESFEELMRYASTSPFTAVGDTIRKNLDPKLFARRTQADENSTDSTRTFRLQQLQRIDGVIADVVDAG